MEFYQGFQETTININKLWVVYKLVNISGFANDVENLALLTAIMSAWSNSAMNATKASQLLLSTYCQELSLEISTFALKTIGTK